MKKVLLSLLAAAGITASANAQLPDYTIFPNFTLTAVWPTPGQTVNLDSFLDAGYTVFIDISATWCHPCWEYHSSGALDSLWADHGPTGWLGVNATTTNNVVVLFVQGEPTSHLAELFDGPGATVGSASVETPAATASQGNWTASTTYPMVDDTTSTDPTYGTSAIDAAWDITYFPTVYMICRDHILHVLTQPTAAQAYDSVQAGCPNYAPAPGSSVDAKAVPFAGGDYFICDANPTVTFQNYSSTTNITSATITVNDASGTAVATLPWSGTLAPYGLANVVVTPFYGEAAFGTNYSFYVSVTGNVGPAADDTAQLSTLYIYDSLNSISLPTSYVETFGETSLPIKEAFSNTNLITPASQLNNPSDPGTGLNITGPSGSADTCLMFDDYDAYYEYGLSDYVGDFILGNYNNDGSGSYAIAFDESYAAKSGTSTTDNLKVQVSTDCGDTWTPIWTGTGATLETAASVSSNWFVPTAATQWKHVIAALGSKSSNLMVEFEGTGVTTGSESIFVDNIAFVNASLLQVQKVNFDDQVSVYPNPAKDMAYVSLTLAEDANIQVELSDALGRVITTINQQVNSGSTQIEVPTAELPTGLYNVKIVNGTSVTVKKLSVIK